MDESLHAHRHAMTLESTMSEQSKPVVSGTVDLDEVAKLVAALEKDLAGVKAGSRDLQTLRDEVRALGEALEAKDAPADHARVGDSLKSIHDLIDNAVDIVIEDSITAADYARRIGKMLGL
jgi:hypothetical protein